MNLTTDRSQGVSIVRIQESRLMYPLLSEFAGTVAGLINSGEQKVLLDLSSVTYVDSATIGCLMDLYRQVSGAGGALKLSGVQKRVETMLTMTGAQNFIEIHPDEPRAHYPRRRSARRHGSALQGNHRQARVRAILRRHGARDSAPDRADER